MNWNHILHTIRKDFRFYRFHLILWVSLLAIYVAIAGRGNLEQLTGAATVAILANVLPGVVMIYGLVIVVGLIHQDPVAGTSAFWTTRPIRGINLLLAKAIEAALMLAFLFLADLLILASNGAASHAGYLAFDSAVSLLPLTLAMFVVAALVPNTTRFLIAVALATAGAALIAMIINLAGDWFFVTDHAKNTPRTQAEGFSAQVFAATIMSLGALAILGWQFITRRTGISTIAALIVVAGASVAIATWSHDFIAPRPHHGDLPDQFDTITAEIDRSEFRSGTTTESIGDGDPIEYRIVSVKPLIHGLPEGVFAEWGAARTRILTAGGQEFIQHGENPYVPVSAEAISHTLGGAILRANSSGETWRAIVRASADEFEKFAHQPCTLESEVQVKLFRYALLGELPLEVGSELNYDGLQLQITNVNYRLSQQTMLRTEASQPDAEPTYECEVSFSETYPNSKSKAVRTGIDYRNPYSDIFYVLLNRETGDAVLSNGGGSSSFGGIRQLFHQSDRHLDFQPAFTGNALERLPQMDAAWLAGATLAILKRESIGEITRTARVEDVVFSPLQGVEPILDSRISAAQFAPGDRLHRP